MSDELVRLTAPEVLDTRDVVARLLDAWRASLSAATRMAYGRDVEFFARWSGAASAAAAISALLRGGKLAAEERVLAWLASLRNHIGSATLHRRRAALRSVVRMAEGLGVVTWELTAPLPRSDRPRSLRDTRGPGLPAVRAMRQVAAAQDAPKGPRDVALLGLLYALGLRRAEVCALDVSDFDPAEQRIAIIGKGHSEPEWVTLPPETAAELQAYVGALGHAAAGPMFMSADRAHKGTGRLTSSGLYRVVRKLGERAGVTLPVSPHRLRHSAITAALDGLHGDVRRVRQFSRHSKLETVMIYDDRRRDQAGEVAGLLASALGHAGRAAGPAVDDDDAVVEAGPHGNPEVGR
jgi:integrase/recombinase XerC